MSLVKEQDGIWPVKTFFTNISHRFSCRGPGLAWPEMAPEKRAGKTKHRKVYFKYASNSLKYRLNPHNRIGGQYQFPVSEDCSWWLNLLLTEVVNMAQNWPLWKLLTVSEWHCTTSVLQARNEDEMMSLQTAAAYVSKLNPVIWYTGAGQCLNKLGPNMKIM